MNNEEYDVEVSIDPETGLPVGPGLAHIPGLLGGPNQLGLPSFLPTSVSDFSPLFGGVGFDDPDLEDLLGFLGPNELPSEMMDLLGGLGRGPMNLGGALTLGGGGSGGSGGSGGGGAYNYGGLRETLAGVLGQGLDLNGVDNQLDPRFQDQAEQIRALLEGSRGLLPGLDPETLAGLDEQLAYELQLAQQQALDQKDDFLTRMFGQGMETSTPAGEMGARLLQDQGLVTGGIRAADQERRLGIRSGLAQSSLQNLALQSENLNAERLAALEELGFNVQERLGILGTAGGLQSSLISGDSSIKSSQIAASAQRYAAQLGAQSSMANALLGAQASMFGTLGSMESSRNSSANSLLANLYNTQSSNSQFLSGQQFNIANALLQAMLTREGFANNVNVARLGQGRQPSSFERILGLIAGGAGTYFGSR